ncbi:MAG TPA: GNAT family N-acetyltransferase [Rhizomicrobium sp.]|jgi:phosphinothricin acetyltransferase|nr:GNAT family N-acetyltransferase [Rhizomicrobium sp.]
MNDISIRRAARADLPRLLDIYNHYIVNTPVTFDTEPKTLAEREEWFGQFSDRGKFQCFVADRGGSAAGWVSSTRFKQKDAYATTVETSIYLAPGETGKGAGRSLYEALFAALKSENLHMAFAGVVLPNDRSIGLHRSMGFRQAGVQPQIGRKFDRYWDIAQMFKCLDGD